MAGHLPTAHLHGPSAAQKAGALRLHVMAELVHPVGSEGV